jgi:hypothetical protein
MNQEPTEKPRVEIEAPSAAQIRAAKQMRRQQDMGHLQAPTAEKKVQKRFAIEGVVLMLLAMALGYFLHPLGNIGLMLAALPFLGGVIVLMKGWQ